MGINLDNNKKRKLFLTKLCGYRETFRIRYLTTFVNEKFPKPPLPSPKQPMCHSVVLTERILILYSQLTKYQGLQLALGPQGRYTSRIGGLPHRVYLIYLTFMSGSCSHLVIAQFGKFRAQYNWQKTQYLTQTMVNTVVLPKLYKNYFVDTSKITRGVQKLLEHLNTFTTISIKCWSKVFNTPLYFSLKIVRTKLKHFVQTILTQWNGLLIIT